MGSEARWKLAATLGVTLLVGYYDRLNISLALPLIALEQGWTEAETADYGSLLLGLFYAGYGVANIFLSPLGARAGPRTSLVVIIILWSLFTAMGAVVSQVLTLFMASRVLLGLAEGIHFPMMNQLTQTWFPADERSRANAIWISGLFLAVLTAPLLLVPLMDARGWRAGFWFLAAAGLVMSLPLVLRYVYDRPSEHPRLDAVTATAISDAVEATRDRDPDAAEQQLRTLLARPVLQLLILAGILNNVVALGIAGWLPTYLSRIEGVLYADLAYLAALPYVASLGGIAFWAVLGDRSNRRAWLAAGGYTAAGALACLALTAGNANALWPTVALFSASVFCVAAYTASEFALLQRILPPALTAAAVGLYNGLTTMLGGGLGPYVIGGLIEGRSTPGDLALLFGLCASIAIALSYYARRVRY